jgi:ketosteroid isomerase-like protein
MPFVNIALARGKSPEYLEAVSQAVHGALVAELRVKPDDHFQLIHQHDPTELKYSHNFRGGPRSDDWIVLTITASPEPGERAKRKFYKTLIRLLEEDPGVRPADVFVMMTVTPPENFSFADGVIGTDVVAAEALDAAAKITGTRSAYTTTEMAAAITELFTHRDPSPILSMLRDDFVLKVPTTLPYGGEFTGPGAFARFFTGTPGGSEVWESFTVHFDDVIESDDHLIARLTNTAVPKASGKTVVFQNLWLFEVADGKFAHAQLYADTAAVQPTAG